MKFLRFLLLLPLLAPFFINGATPAEEVNALIKRAEEGDAQSIFILATLYDRGFDSIPVDSARSTELYREAAEKGNTEAMNYLGYRLLSGEYSALGQDVEKGMEWIEKAAMSGDTKAASNIGWLLTEGKYVEQDFEKAAFWLEKASDRGLTVAMSQLGDLYRDGKGVEKSYETADRLYREAFERGLTDAGYKLMDLREDSVAAMDADQLVREGKYYYLRSAPSIGVKLFYLASEQGNPEAMALIGDAYTRAIGVPYDHELSLLYFAKAADAGNAPAQFVIGELLEIFPDALNKLDQTQFESPLSDNPFYWYEKAAEAGIKDAEAASRMLLQE